MRRMPWATYLWPGLPQLWTEGAWSGLVLACGFGLLLNLLVLASFVWQELLSLPLVAVGWMLAVGVWVTAIVLTGRRRAVPARETGGPGAEDLFCAALGEYLRGHWFEAESLLGRLFEKQPRDIEARLLLATLLRHTNRFAEAREQLARLDRIEGSLRWSEEIRVEKELLAQASTPAPRLWTDSMVMSKAA